MSTRTTCLTEEQIKLAELFKVRFNELFPEFRLLAFKLDGFSHTAWYDEGSASSSIKQLYYTGCASEQKPIPDERAKTLLSQYPHYCYQGQPLMHAFILPEER